MQDGHKKGRIPMDLTEAEGSKKRWHDYRGEFYK